MRTVAAILACLFLVSCSSRQIIEPDRGLAETAYLERAAHLSILSSWDLAGKLSLDDGEDGGSGKLKWSVRAEKSHMDFRGALGRGAWQLDSGPGYARLARANGETVYADSISDLVEQEVGWQIPVDSLRWWALGIYAPGDIEGSELDAQGRVLTLKQQGWDISFERYRVFGDQELPARIEAVNGPYRIKVAMTGWTLPVTEISDG
jgi:outer membrane lipoprotein LolB